MSTVYLKRTDEMVARLINATFPGFTGTRIQADVAQTVRFSGTNWDEGNKTDYAIVRLADLTTQGIAESPYFRDSPLHSTDFPIPDGFVVVAHEHCRGREYLRIITPGANITPLLEAPSDLTGDERIVLLATRSFKSSYAGISNYRFHEAQSKGITLDRWESAKSALIAKKLLNKAGAITTEGRNAIANDRF